MELDLISASSAGVGGGAVVVYIIRSLIASNNKLAEKVDKMHETIIKLEVNLSLKNSEHEKMINENAAKIAEVDKLSRERYHKLSTRMQQYEVDFTKMQSK